MDKEKSVDQDVITFHLKVPCYLVKTMDGFILVDTGDSSDRANLVKALDHAMITPENLRLVLLTHGDFDHAGNAAFLQEGYAVKIAMHAGDLGMVTRGDMGWNRKTRPDRISFFGRIIIFISTHFARPAPFNTFTPDILLEDGQNLREYGFNAQVLHLPAHSKGSIGILTAEGDLFCGDLLVNMVKPDPHFLIDDYAAFTASIEKLKKQLIKTVYPGHGKPFLLEQFMKNFQMQGPHETG
jgi:hydroxyacylglutathione hydrolase